MIILGHPKGKPLAKAWRSTEAGPQENREVFAHAIKVRHLEALGERFFRGSIADLFNLADIIEDYQDRRSVCLVRGGLTQTARARAQKRAEKIRHGQHPMKGLIYRASDQTEGKGDVMDTPCHIIPLDLDSVEMSEGSSVTEAIEEVINTRLAPCFRGMSYVYQLSGSMGFKSGLRVKLFFTASRAVTQQELRTLWRQERLIDSAKLKAEGMSDKERLNVIDGALYQRAQMIFISKPHLSRLADPYPDRTGLIRKALSVIELPEVEKERERPQITLPRTKLIVEDRGAETALERAAQRLTLASDGRYAEAFTIARYLGRFWTAGRLPESRIVFTLLQAAEANGSTSKHGRRSIERQIKNGVKAALTAEPLHPQELREYPELDHIEYSPSQAPKPQPLTLPDRSADHTPSTASEISEEVERVIELACGSSSKIMSVVSVPVGSGKSHHGILKAVRALNQGRTVIYAADSYALIEEAEEKLKRLAPQVRSHRYEGKLRGCKLYMDHPEEREEINQVIAEGVDIPQLCKGIGCPFWEKCDLRKEAYKRTAPELEGRLTFTTHAMIPHLDKHLAELEEEPLILIDESPQLSYFSEAALSDLEALYPTAQELNKAPQSYDDVWRLDHPQSRAFASLITPHLMSWVKPLQVALSSPHARDIQPADLAHRLRELEGVIDLAHAMLKEEPQPPKVKEKDDRDSRARAIIEGRARLVKASAIRGLKSLAKLITGEALSVALAYDKTSAWIETGSALKLPERGKVVILDATLNPMRWDLLAHTSGRQLEQVKADEEKLRPHLAQGVWIESTSFSRSKLFKGEHMTNRGRAALHNLGELCSQHDLIKGKIGIGTHKQLAELIEDGKQGQGALEAHSISAWAAQEEVKTGYTGRDHRGSNKFEECETLLIIGDPTTNKRRERRILETLMISSGKLEPLSAEEADQDYQHELESYQVQWIGRGRHIRREGVRFIYVGRFKPTSSSGIIWSKLSAPQGRPPSPDRGHALKMALEALQRGEAITQSMIEGLGVSRKTARGVWKQLVDQDWAQVSKEGRSRVLKASDPNMALIGYPYKDRVLCCEEKGEAGGKSLYKSKGYSLGHIPERPPEPEPPPLAPEVNLESERAQSSQARRLSGLSLLFSLVLEGSLTSSPSPDHTPIEESYELRGPPPPLIFSDWEAHP